MNKQPTPGPWTVSHSDGGVEWRVVGRSGPYPMTVVVAHSDGNAYLIAAAHELREALRTALNHQSGNGIDYQPWADAARAALAKSEGA